MPIPPSAAVLLLFVLSSFVVAPRVGAEENPGAVPDLIFVLIGQSNMAGRAPLEEADLQEMEGILLLNDRGEWEVAKNPLNRFASHRKVLSMQRLGPGSSFVQTIRKAMPGKTIGVVVNARGGSKIEEWGADQPYYLGTVKRLESVPRARLAGLIWHQGEGNSRDPEYLEKLTELIARFRATLDSPELPFVVGEIYGDRPVNQQLRKLSEVVPQTGCATAEGLEVFDGVHFDRRSQIALGERYAQVWLNLQAKRASSPSRE